MKENVPMLIRQAREKLGLSQAALAARLEVSTNTVRNWENGRSTPAISIRPLLETVLEISLQEQQETTPALISTQPDAATRVPYEVTASTQQSLKEKNRMQMLNRVHLRWIRGVLENSLYLATLIRLGLRERPHAVANPWRLVVQESSQVPERHLPPGTSLTKVYDEYNEEILVLGEPGAGKTTLLLDLTKDLLQRAERNDAHPLPVVFNLSSWAKKSLPLQGWMIEELQTKYQIPKRLAQEWVVGHQILPLLDGLDEVVASSLSSCIEAINSYRQEHGMMAMVVCCRKADYFRQSMRLLLSTAVEVQPLTAEQIDAYLTQAGKDLTAVRVALQQDPILRDVASTPLMLSTIAATYHDQPISSMLALHSVAERRQMILENYIERVLEQRGSFKKEAKLQQTKSYLAWLAKHMLLHGQTEFYVERMQPDLLDDASAQRGYRTTIIRSIYALQCTIIGALFAWIFGGKPEPGNMRGVGDGLLGLLGSGPGNAILGWMAPGLGGGLEGGGMFGMILGLVFIVVTLLIDVSGSSQQVSWAALRAQLVKSLLIGLRNGIVSGGCIGSLCGLFFFAIRQDLSYAFSQALGFGAFTGNIIGLVSLLVVTLRVSPEREEASSLSVGLVTRLIDGIVIGGCGGLGFGLVSSLLVNVQQGAIYGGIVGIAFGLTFGFAGGTRLIRDVGTISPAEIVRWNWHHAFANWSGILIKGLVIGLMIFLMVMIVLGSAGSLLHDSVYAWKYGCVYGIIVGASATVASILTGILNSGWESNTLDERHLMRPNEGIRRSLYNSLFAAGCFGPIGGIASGGMVGFAFGLIAALPGWPVLALGFAIILGSVFALEFAMLRGGIAFLAHYLLRWYLWREKYLPWRYIRFLDYAASRILLRKIGGGYIFHHRMLLEYFAAYGGEVASRSSEEEPVIIKRA
ncbi:hypothetical protein KSF_109420 [Reticulibacter mediterranei]|uniref:NACHT domain-containing protein n=1 Tax=Reticulibacter mediterranei TaxID=2778369 RepID=A0A8J3IZK8_9CHLR|nr:helix-turn-helix domain-containing protein [Reticulibacter mediterranei]GHP00895.1 hypothetical protein KSF_109420 [Reticulibacter mediterranei]